MLPWNDWYHVMCHTYGTWLPGDPKGFRTCHHREHIEGDYKNLPPAGRDAARWEHAKKLMNRDPVYLDYIQRKRAVVEIVKSFAKWKVELEAVAIDQIHLHALIRVIDNNPRHYVGLAKKECSAYMKRDGVASPGGLWGVRCECVPIESGRHFKNVDGYIRDHLLRGAEIWPAPKNDMDDFNPACLLLE